jgi:hypothetical protein
MLDGCPEEVEEMSLHHLQAFARWRRVSKSAAIKSGIIRVSGSCSAGGGALLSSFFYAGHTEPNFR